MYFYQHTRVVSQSPKQLRASYEKKSLRRLSDSFGLMLLATLVLSLTLSFMLFYIARIMGLQNQRLISNDFNGYSPNIYYIISGLAYILSLVLPVSIIVQYGDIKIKKIISFKKTGLSLSLYLFIFGFAACAVSNIDANIFSNIFYSFGIDLSTPDFPYSNNILSAVLFIFINSALPAVIEELIFRGIVLTSLKRFGDIFAILASSVVFALMHNSFVQIPFAFLIGLVLGFIRIKTDSLLLPVCIHFANNFISCIFTILYSTLSDTAYSVCFLLYLLLSMALGLFAVYALVKYHTDIFALKKGHSILKFSQKLSAFFESPFLIISFFIAIVMTVVSQVLV